MRLLLVIISFPIFVLCAHAQTAKPIRWSFALSKNEVKQGDIVEIIMKAEINSDWYLYSSDFSAELGPTVSSITFTENGSYKTIGALKAIGAKEKYDSLWEGKIKYFVKTGEFRQKVKILTTTPMIKAILSYQVCSDKEGKCIPYDETISFNNLKVIAMAIEPDKQAAVEVKTVSKIDNPSVKTTPPSKTNLSALEAEKEKLVQKDGKGNDSAVDQLKKFSQKYGGDK